MELPNDNKRRDELALPIIFAVFVKV